MDILDFSNFYLVGIKGVAMTSMAQLLIDAKKVVKGCDVAEDFVTKEILDNFQIKIDSGFSGSLPEEVDCVIYTAAHQGKLNPVVKAAEEAGVPVISQAEALSYLFNKQQGIAVCGVGGKSTTSAMISWILDKAGLNPSFSVGVGKIIGMDRTGRYNPDSNFFVAEADEYVTDPTAKANGEIITPRFSYLKPHITVLRNVLWDHPDVYDNLKHTQAVFNEFFKQIDPNGVFIYPASERFTGLTTSAGHELSYGESSEAEVVIRYSAEESAGQTVGYINFEGREHRVILQVPGKYNFDNAAAAILASHSAGVSIEDAIEAIKSFQSTQRRFEKIGEKNGVLYFDDYAHHPREVEVVIAALKQWYPEQRAFIAFQPHTYSRTKELFEPFVEAFRDVEDLLLLDIFASARETAAPDISSDLLVSAIKEAYPDMRVQNVHHNRGLAGYLKQFAKPGDVCLTIGAGDIYQVHEMI